MEIMNNILVVADAIARLFVIIVLSWPFVGIISANLVYTLFKISITWDGIEFFRSNGDDREGRFCFSIIGSILGWIAVVLMLLAIFLWLVLQFISLVVGVRSTAQGKKIT